MPAPSRPTSDGTSTLAASLTFRELFEAWAAPGSTTAARPASRKDGGKSTRRQFERRLFPRFGDAPATDFTRADALDVLNEVQAEGRRHTGHVLLSDLKHLLRFGVAQGLLAEDPLQGLTRSDLDEAAPDPGRTLSVEEIALLGLSLPRARLNKRSELALWLMLATGGRPAEVLNAQWPQVNRVTRTWHVPKGEKHAARNLPLSSFGLRIVSELAALGEASPWLFPNRRGTGPVGTKAFSKQIRDRQREPDAPTHKRTRAAGSLTLPGGRWRPHDLRRTTAALMATMSVPQPVIAACLNPHPPALGVMGLGLEVHEDELAQAFEALGNGLAAVLQTTSAT